MIQSFTDLPSIHNASKNGDLETVILHIKKGIDPFIPDENGFSPLYFGKEHNHIVQWYDTKYPAKFPILCVKDQFLKENNSALAKEITTSINNKTNLKKFFSLDAEINEALRWCGLRSFSLDLSSYSQKQGIPSFILKLFDNFIQGVKSDDDFQIVDETSLSHCGNDDFQIVDETSLSHCVFGIIEEISPVTFLEVIIKEEPHLNHQQMSLCIYFIKELIKHDTDNEYILESNFTKILSEFLDREKNPAIKKFDIIEKLKNFYMIKSTFTLKTFYDHIDSFRYKTHLDLSSPKQRKKLKEPFCQDLFEIMRNLILNSTPSQFFDARKGKNPILNNPWGELLNATNGISNMVRLDILNAKNSERRGKIKFYQMCIDYCLMPQISNFAAAHALYAGLHTTAITRLEIKIGSKASKVQDDFFKKSPGEFTKLSLTSNALPPISCYAGYKEQVKENKLEDRVFLNGRFNFIFFWQHRLYALSSHSQGCSTNLQEKLEKLSKRDSAEAFHISYVLKPPKIIQLKEMPSLEDLEKTLEEKKAITAPLVVCIGKNNLVTGTMAASIILNYANEHFKNTIKLEILCDEIIKNFDSSAPQSEPFEEIIPSLKNWRIISSPSSTSSPSSPRKVHSEGDLDLKKPPPSSPTYIPSFKNKLSSLSVPSSPLLSPNLSRRITDNRKQTIEEDNIKITIGIRPTKNKKKTNPLKPM